MGNEERQVNEEKTCASRRSIVLTMLLSFGVPVIVTAAAFWNNQIWVHGVDTVFIYDLQAQFAPVYASLKHLENSDSSLFYSFYGALGGNSFPNLISYMMDPLSWLAAFFPLKSLPDVIYVITLIKIGACGLSFCIFLLYGNHGRKYLLLVFVLSCCYALMSYNIMYSECLLWLNVVALTPMVLLGVNSILDGKKGIIFILMMFLTMCYVFQMAFMTGIFVILYCLYRMTYDNKNAVRRMIRLGWYTVLSLGLYMPICIPTIINTVNGRFLTDDSIDGKMFYYPIWKVFSQLISCRYDTIDVGGLPLIFCGTMTIVLVVLFFVSKEPRPSSKIAAFLIIVFYFFSFCFRPLNRMWHGFVEPHAFPCRYSYTLCCFMLILAYQAGLGILAGIKNLSRFFVAIAGALLLLFVLFEQYMNASYIISSNNIAMGYRLRWYYDNYIEHMEDIFDHICDEEFYRIGRDAYTFSMNDGMLLGYNGISYFSSFYSRNAMGLIGTLGYSQSEYAMSEMGATPLVESILGVKYRISRKSESFPSYDTLYESSPDVLGYNPHALPVAVIMGNSAEIKAGKTGYVDPDDKGNAFAYQELMLSDIYGSECHVYESIDYDMQDIDDGNARHIKVRFIAQSTDPIWLYCKAATAEEINNSKVDPDEAIGSVYIVNGENRLAVRSTLSTVCAYVGTFAPGEEVVIEASDGMYFGDPWIVYYDSDKCGEILDEIASRGFDVTYHDKGGIKGNINAPYDDSYMLLTLPYIDGYKIKVDGKPTEYESYRNSLLLVPLSRGEHYVEISFVPPGLKEGVIVGLAALIICIILLFVPHNGKELISDCLVT